MRQEIDPDDRTVSVPVDGTGEVEIEEYSDGLHTVREVDEDGTVPPFAIGAANRPILVDVHFGRSAVVGTPIDAVRFGYRESEFRTEFYYLDVLDEPKWDQITEETDDPDVGIPHLVDEWVANRELTDAEGEWAKEQFE